MSIRANNIKYNSLDDLLLNHKNDITSLAISDNYDINNIIFKNIEKLTIEIHRGTFNIDMQYFDKLNMLTLYGGCYNILDNLPNSLKFLNICIPSKDIRLNITNLPIALEKLNLLMSNTISFNINEHTIKVPYGCIVSVNGQTKPSLRDFVS
jgi:hypothetical protein